MKKEKKYIVLIADIRNSKKIEKRNEVQKKLLRTIDKINDYFYDSVASNFTITLGDEFQGVLKSSGEVLDIISYLRLYMPEIDFRYGIGIGRISTAINRKISIGADGEAFYLARKAIDIVKSYENKNTSIKTNLNIQCTNHKVVESLNLLLSNMAFMYSKMSKYQKDIVNQLLVGKELVKKSIINIDKIANNSLNRTLRRVGYYTYRDSYRYINNIVGDLLNED